MARGNRVDFNPEFKRDPEQILASYRADKAKIEEKMEQPDVHETVVPETNAPERPKIEDAEDIKDLETFREFIDNIAEKFEDVNERTEILLDNLSDFEIKLPDTLYESMYVIKGIPYSQRTTPEQDGVNVFNKNTADCINKTLAKQKTNFDKIATSPEMVEPAIKSTVLKSFPSFKWEFLILLALMIMKASAWNIFRSLCVMFRRIRIKVGPFKFCLGCPIAKLFKELVAVLNGIKIKIKGVPIREVDQGTTVEGKVVNTGKYVSYVDDQNQLMDWGNGKSGFPRYSDGCPPKYSFTLLEDERQQALTDLYRGEDASNEPAGTSICASAGNATPEELDAIKQVELYVLQQSASQNQQDAKAAEYLKTQKTWDNVKSNTWKTIRDSVAAHDSATDEKVKASNGIGIIKDAVAGAYNTDGAAEADKAHQIDALQSISNLRASLAANKGDTDATTNSAFTSSGYEDSFIDGATKGMLQLAIGMLKVWDGAVSAINNTFTMSPLSKDLICCLLNAFTALALDINGPTASADFKHAQEKVKAAILVTLRFLKMIIDLRVGSLASELSASFYTLDQLWSSIQNAIIESIVTGVSPYVDGLTKEIHNILNLNKWAVDCDKSIKGAQESLDKAKLAGNADDIKRAEGELYFRKKLCEAKLNCKPLNFLFSFADCEIAKLKITLMDWIIGLKGKTDDSAKLIELNVKQSSEAKVFFLLSAILDGMIDSLEKGFEGFFSFCSGNNDLNPFGVPTVEQTLSENASLTFGEDGVGTYVYPNGWKQLPDPVFDPSKNYGIETDDAVDLAFNTPSKFYEPTYASMPEYKKFIASSAAIISNSQSELAADVGVKTIPTNDNTPTSKLDETYRDCSSDDRVRILFDMMMKSNHLEG